MRYQLTAADREALTELWRRMRTASHNANLASAKWNRINAELTDYATRSGLTDEQTAQVKAANRALSDAFGGWSFWEREVSRLALTLQAERAARELFGLVDDETDEHGWFYQRENDDEADDGPRRPTKPHVGFSIVSPGRAEAAARRRNSSPAGPHSPDRPGPHTSGAQAGARASGPGRGETVAGASVSPALRGEGGVW